MNQSKIKANVRLHSDVPEAIGQLRNAEDFSFVIGVGYTGGEKPRKRSACYQGAWLHG